jgi:hypothetical protein
MDRQSILARPAPPQLWVILEEAVIRRPVGGDAVMREQLAHILRLAAAPHIFVQVLPISRGAHGALGSALSLLWLADGTEAAYLEGGYDGQFIENPEDVARYELTYDLLRANALPPGESAAFIRTVMEVSFPCETPPS